MKVGIIGGGASGLACGIFLARAGLQVQIFERKDRVGKKLLATGNGRCNLGNRDLSMDHFHSVEGDIPEGILKSFGLKESQDFFQSLGIDIVEEARGKLYPVTLTAATVLNALRDELNVLGVEEIIQKKIDEIMPTKRGFVLKSNGQEFPVDKVVVATGGMSMPKSGSDGSAYKLLENLGHSRTRQFPAICAVQLDSPYLKHLSGTKIQGEVSLYSNKGHILTENGEILLAKDGISGPPVLDISRYVNENEEDKWVSFPLINHLDQLGQDYRQVLESRSYMDRSIENFLQGIVSKKWIHVIVKELGLDKESSTLNLEYKQREALLDMLFSYKMKVVGTRDYESAQVTCGGISLKEFDEKTLESKIVPGLFALGELLDLDGDCGGYNLHWAWASAWTCSKGVK